jgi:hypothetical protein
MDQLVLPPPQKGVLSVETTAGRLRVNFKRDAVVPFPAVAANTVFSRSLNIHAVAV